MEQDTKDRLRAGYFGKVPTQGDFVSNGLNRNLTDSIDLWLRAAMRESQRAMGRDWLNAFLVAPIWRLALGAGVAGPDPVIGVMMPSVDRVGRYFPLVIATHLTGRAPALEAMARLDMWYMAAEHLALSTLEASFALARFDEAVAALDLPVSQLPPDSHGEEEGRSIWWVGNAPDTAACFDGFPDPADFGGQFLGRAVQSPDQPESDEALMPAQHHRILLSADCAHASLKGTRSPILSEAAVINRDCQAMSVVSGIGTHPKIAAAAQVVADTLAQVENPFSMNDLVAEAKGKLGTANTLLRARGMPTGETFAVSTVTLLVQAERYSVLWAGNARAYLLRNGLLSLLTRDHVGSRLPGFLIRAIGSGPQISLDSAIGQACDGDRFLLCSAGLSSALTDAEIAETLSRAQSAHQAVTHLTQDALIAGAALDATALVVILSQQSPDRNFHADSDV